MPTKLVLVHQNVPDADVIIDALKGDCVSLRDFSTEERLTDRALTAVDGTIERIAFVWSNPGSYRIPFASSAECADNVFCDGFKADIKQMVDKAAASVTVDLVSCNLTPADVEAEISALEAELSVGGKTVTFEYSIDQTGNGPQGNWIMESNGVDIEPVYFTEEIQQYAWILDATMTSSSLPMVPFYDTFNGELYFQNRRTDGRSEQHAFNRDGTLKVYPASKLHIISPYPNAYISVADDVVSYVIDWDKVIYIRQSGQLGVYNTFDESHHEPALLSSGVKKIYPTRERDQMFVHMNDDTVYHYASVRGSNPINPTTTYTNVKNVAMRGFQGFDYVVLKNDGTIDSSSTELATQVSSNASPVERVFGQFKQVYALTQNGKLFSSEASTNTQIDTNIHQANVGAKIIQFLPSTYGSIVVLDNYSVYRLHAEPNRTPSLIRSGDTQYPIKRFFTGARRSQGVVIFIDNSFHFRDGGSSLDVSSLVSQHGELIDVYAQTDDLAWLLFADGTLYIKNKYLSTFSVFVKDDITTDTKFVSLIQTYAINGYVGFIAKSTENRYYLIRISSGYSGIEVPDLAGTQFVEGYGHSWGAGADSSADIHIGLSPYGTISYTPGVGNAYSNAFISKVPEINSPIYSMMAQGFAFAALTDPATDVGIGYNGEIDPQDPTNGGGGVPAVQLPTADVIKFVNVDQGKFTLSGGSRIDFIPGKTYAFIQDNQSNTGHPFSISEDSAGSAPTAGVTFVGTPGSITNGMPAHTLYQVPADSFVDKRYFYCTVHGAAMGSDLKGVAGFGASSKMAHHFAMKNNFNDRLGGSITLHSTGSAPQYELITDDGYSRLGYGLKMDGSSAYYTNEDTFPYHNSGYNMSFWVKRVGSHGTLMYVVNRHFQYNHHYSYNISVSSSQLGLRENQWEHIYIHGGGNEYNFDNKWRGFWVYVNGVYKTQIGGGNWDRYIFGHKKIIFSGSPTVNANGAIYDLDGIVGGTPMGAGTMIADFRYMDQLISQDELTQIRTMNAQYYLPTGLTPKEQAVADLKREFETDDSMTDAEVDAALTRAEAVTAADGEEVNVKDVLDITAHKDDPVKSRKLRRAVIDLMFAAKASFQKFVSSVEDLNLDRDVVGRSKVKVFKKTAGPIVIEDEVDPDTAIHVPMSETDDEATLVVNGVTMTVRKTDLGYVIVEPSGELVKYGNGDVMYFQEGEVAFYKDLTLIFGSVTVIQMIGDIRYIFLPEVGQTARVVISDAESYDVERHSYNQYKVTILNSTDGTTGNEYLFYHETVQDILSEKVNFSAPPQAGGSAGDPYIYCLTQDNV